MKIMTTREYYFKPTMSAKMKRPDSIKDWQDWRASYRTVLVRTVMNPLWKIVMSPTKSNSTPRMGGLLHGRLCLISTAAFGGGGTNKKK